MLYGQLSLPIGLFSLSLYEIFPLDGCVAFGQVLGLCVFFEFLVKRMRNIRL